MSFVLKNLIRAVFLFFLIIGCTSMASTRDIELIILLDLTGSVSPVLEDYKERIYGILKSLPENGCITIMPIIDDSYGKEKKIFNKGCISARQYIFDSKSEKNKAHIIERWSKYSQSLSATKSTTDVFGAVRYTEWLFSQSKDNYKILLIFSDMRHNAKGIDLSGVIEIPPDILSKVKERKLMARLEGVKVLALGVHMLNKDERYIDSLKNFWEEYFKESGSSLEAFSSIESFSSTDAEWLFNSMLKAEQN